MEISLKKGITSFQLKIIGIVLMTFDHIGAFLAIPTPIWFGWLGRPVATIFLFTSAEGYYYTRNKKKYLLRLLIGFWTMNLLNTIFSKFLPIEGIELYANIFGAIFWSVLSMYLYDLLKYNFRNKKYFSIFLIILFIISSLTLSFIIPSVMSANLTLGTLLFNIVPTPLFVEGGILYILMALLFYTFKDKKKMQIFIILIFSMYYLISSISLGNILSLNYQWMAIFAILPIYLYNGQKGKSMKSFFYGYYILHIFAIYVVSYFIMK
ncbi:hypothetical protein CHF27_013140 [Romboutsia maritimum]|uniref:Conjugal transfer protein TraX n=1 Tax=Romboutsia maritimum TaxID=2020948 RepID=A0A255IEX8_9FIRM|nr:TraX family protein [Romboutsia maritimum]RDY22493.1 hypothetical protein CHF27_013140 [Romboutsia maritimum]